MVKAYFKNIRKSILNELLNASKSVKVAVYWFTNHDLFDMLYQKQLSGVQCELIIHNDYINNRETGLPFQKLIDAGGKFFFSDEVNPMHNKFCIIDNQVLINGSYNWTYYAESKNRENILIIKQEPVALASFNEEFEKLVGLIEPVNNLNPTTKFEVDENNLLRAQDYLAHDIVFQAKATNKPEIVQSAFDIAPNNLEIQKIAYNLDLVKKYKLKHSVGVGIVNDEVKFIAKKGASIPATFTTIVRTSYSNQTKSVTDIVFGEQEKATINRKLTVMTLNGLPKKPAGKAEVKFTFSIDLMGKIRIEKMSLDNGKKEIINQNAKWLIEENF
ncbi:MAG: Hsp70 family protein [Flavobacteriales bacterium]|nr:Hsp70 family protein [Flavobacteriales bacterium]